MLEFSEADGALIFAVKVVPRARRSGAAGHMGGALRLKIAAPPVDGAANEELTRFLSRALDVPACAIEIISGHASKSKRMRIAGVVRARIESLAAL